MVYIYIIRINEKQGEEGVADIEINNHQHIWLKY